MKASYAGFSESATCSRVTSGMRAIEPPWSMDRGYARLAPRAATCGEYTLAAQREVEMSSFDEYAGKYQTARMERRNGVLQVTLHTDGQSLRWGFLPHGELPEVFRDIGADRENRVVILTGTGAEFSGPRASPGT